MNRRDGAAGTCSLLCDYSWEDMKKCLLTPGREPVADQSMDVTEVPCGKSVSLLRLLTRVWVGVTYRSKRLKDSCVTNPPPPPVWLTAHEKLETWSSLHNWQAAHQVGECPYWWLDWSESLPGSSAGLCFFQASLFESLLRILAVFIAYILSRRKGPL